MKTSLLVATAIVLGLAPQTWAQNDPSQIAARDQILALGNSLIEKRAAILRDAELTRADSERSQKLAELDHQLAQARHEVATSNNGDDARNKAQQVLDRIQQIQNGYTDAAGKPVLGSRQLAQDSFDTASRVANDAYANTVASESKAYATIVRMAFGGGDKNQDGSYKPGQEPAELVTPTMASHELVVLVASNEKSLADALKAIEQDETLTYEDRQAALLTWARSDDTASALFVRAVTSVIAFRDSVERYRLDEINAIPAANHFTREGRSQQAAQYVEANFETLALSVINSSVLFSELGVLRPSRCVTPDGCGNHVTAAGGSNTADAVKERIDAILKIRQDGAYIDAIRKHLSKTAGADKDNIEAIITALPSTQLSWEALAEAITSVGIYKVLITEVSTGKTTGSDPKTTAEVLDESVLRRYFVK